MRRDGRARNASSTPTRCGPRPHPSAMRSSWQSRANAGTPGSVRRPIPTEDIRVRATARVLAMTLALALVGACSGDDDAPSTEQQIQENAAAGDDAADDLPDPCTLVTEQDAADLFGSE